MTVPSDIGGPEAPNPSLPPPNGKPGRVCPACKKPIDPLRAGQVAVIDGAFVYYCDAACKQAYRSGPTTADLPTASPPDVAVGKAPESTRPLLREAPPSQAPPSAPKPTAPLRSRTRFSLRGAANGSPGSMGASWVIWTAVGLSTLSIILLAARREVGVPELSVLGVGAFAAAVWFVLWPSNASDPQRFLQVAALAAMALGTGGVWAKGGPAASCLIATAMSVLALVAIEVAGRRATGAVDAIRRNTRESLDVPVRAVHGDAIASVPPSQIRCGEVCVVRAGESLGVDAAVISGEAVVTPWLDAPTRQHKTQGDVLVAGARVIEGELRLSVERTGSHRAWVSLHEDNSALIEAAAPLPSFVRKVLPPASALASIAFAVGFGVFTRRWAEALAVGGAVQVALSSGVAIRAVSMLYARAHHAALSRGILYRDAQTFERAATIDQVVYCARGTLLLGEPEIISVEGLAANAEERVRGLAAAVGSVSRDPLLMAVARASMLRGERAEGVRNVVESAGLGVVCSSADGESAVVGSRALLLREKVSVAAADARVTEIEAQGRSVVLVALSGKLLGFVALQDGLSAGARASVQRLLATRIEPILLSSESRDTCEAIASTLEIEHVRPEVLPGDRVAEVRALADGGHAVAVIGHPVSDDAPLAAAPLSIAMAISGAKFSEHGIALLVDDVLEASFALTIPRRARERALLALLVATLPGVVAAVGIGFGVAPLLVAPIAALVECSALLLRERDVARS